jgi:chromosome segregation ATPase
MFTTAELESRAMLAAFAREDSPRCTLAERLLGGTEPILVTLSDALQREVSRLRAELAREREERQVLQYKYGVLKGELERARDRAEQLGREGEQLRARAAALEEQNNRNCRAGWDAEKRAEEADRRAHQLQLQDRVHVNGEGFADNEVAWMFFRVNEAILEADRQGIEREHSSSVFRQGLYDKLLRMRRGLEKARAEDGGPKP